jgi:hypothetical protein
MLCDGRFRHRAYRYARRRVLAVVVPAFIIPCHVLRWLFTPSSFPKSLAPSSLCTYHDRRAFYEFRQWYKLDGGAVLLKWAACRRRETLSLCRQQDPVFGGGKQVLEVCV